GRAAVWGSAPRRDRAGARPHLRDRRRHAVDPGRHRVPEDDVGPRPDDEGAFGRGTRAAEVSRHRAPRKPALVNDPRRIAIGSGDAAGLLWIGPGLISEASRYLVSPSGRFLLVSSAGARGPADGIRRALAGRILADLEIGDREEAKNLEA